ncbi:MAG TPA: hypothetical protein VEY67_10690 [Candidatus Dormibacteraeota bacterium]|nr:hypothetical protein [Candidatus Dormibacteraeota bacterium]
MLATTKQSPDRRRHMPVMTPSRTVARTLLVRVALLLLVSELILGLLPAVIRAVAPAT